MLRASQKIVLIKMTLVLFPFILVLSILHFKGKALQSSVTLSQMGSNYVLIEKEQYHIYVEEKHRNEGEYLGELLQQFYSHFLQEFKDSFHLKNASSKIEIRLFGTRKEFDSYTLRYMFKSMKHNAAYYNPQERSIVLYFDAFENANTLFHELVHAIFDFSLKQQVEPEFSRCFSEGVACFFENTGFTPSHKNPPYSFQFTYGAPPHSLRKILLQQWIKKGSWIPLPDLIQAPSQAFSSAENHFYYYQSEFLVYYLWTQHREKFFQWYQVELEPRPMTFTDIHHLFPDLEAFEQSWKTFILQLP